VRIQQNNAPPPDGANHGVAFPAQTGMQCWEFHHWLRGRKIRWQWRAVNADGTLHSESKDTFKSSIEAFEDARKHGFDKDLHEWYMAPSGEKPCTRIKSADGR
jgi:hypothetical protein